MYKQLCPQSVHWMDGPFPLQYLHILVNWFFEWSAKRVYNEGENFSKTGEARTAQGVEKGMMFDDIIVVLQSTDASVRCLYGLDCCEITERSTQ